MTVSSPAALRARYVADAVSTASPARLLVMLYDKLALDLGQSEDAFRAGDAVHGRDRAAHAQEIVFELMSALEADAWEGGPKLASLYSFLVAELTKAIVGADPDVIAQCRELVAPLREAWHAAAADVAQVAPAAAGGVA
jgi:flagellar protein FliS